MRKALVIAAVLAVAVGVVPVAAEEEWQPNLVTEQVWFVCGDEKVTNLENNTATWDNEPPDQSVTDGAGCGTVDAPFMQEGPGNIYDATWTGWFEGNLDSLTVELHNIYVGPGRATGQLNAAVKLFVDGLPLFDELGEEVTFEAVRSDTGLSEMIRFSIDNIGFVSERDNVEHQINLVMHGGETQNRGPTLTDTVSGWVWDTTEVPSGMVFNPETLEETVLTVVTESDEP